MFALLAVLAGKVTNGLLVQNPSSLLTYMMVKMFPVGMFLTNCYVLSCHETREAVIIDPGFDESREAERVLNFIDESSLRPKFIVNTHGHPDHTCGNRAAKTRFNIPILIHKNDAQMIGRVGGKIAEAFGLRNSSPEADTLLEDGDFIRFGKIILKVMHTPGHSSGSISLLGTNEVITGDTLFACSIGRTDFPDSSERDMRLSLNKLARLPNCYTVYPGHGPTTMIGTEKSDNPFLQHVRLQGTSEKVFFP